MKRLISFVTVVALVATMLTINVSATESGDSSGGGVSSSAPESSGGQTESSGGGDQSSSESAGSTDSGTTSDDGATGGETTGGETTGGETTGGETTGGETEGDTTGDIIGGETTEGGSGGGGSSSGSESTLNEIAIYTIDDLAKIGIDAAYPLDGNYILMTDIVGEEFAPIGTEEQPFSGVFDGNGHIIAKLEIEGDTRSGFFAVLTGEVKNLTLAGVNVIGSDEDDAYSGILAGEIVGANIENLVLTGDVSGKNIGAIAGVMETTTLLNITYHTVTRMPSVSVGTADGALVLRSQPQYIAIVVGQVAKLQVAQTVGEFTFSRFEYDEELTVREDGTSTELEAKESGKFEFKAIYTLDVEGQEIELVLNIPVVVGVDDAGLYELSTIDGVFYTRLGDYEVVQITVLEPLELFEGVFSGSLSPDEPLLNEDATINIIKTWEDFKNIGNTEYNPDYTMDAAYFLGANIVSDGSAFTAIGTEENPFIGEFDGKTYSIDLTANPEIDTTLPYSGLFDVVILPDALNSQEAPNTEEETGTTDEVVTEDVSTETLVSEGASE